MPRHPLSSPLRRHRHARALLAAVTALAAPFALLPLAWALALTAAAVLLAWRRGPELRIVYALLAPLWGHRVFLLTLLRVSRSERGLTPVVRLRLWPLARNPVLVVNDIAVARDIVTRGDVFHTMGLDNPVMRSLLGDSGLFTTHDTSSPEWLRRRRVTDPLLSGAPEYTDTMFADLLATCRTYVRDWQTDEPGLLRAISRVMIPAQSIAFFGPLFDPAVNRQAGEDLMANFRRVGEGLFFRPTDWLRRPWSRGHLGRSWAYIADIARVIVADARGPRGADEPRPAMFRLLADAYRDGTYTEEEVRDTVALFLNAGAPVHLVFWTLHTLAHHPDEQARVAAEVQQVVAGGPLTFARMRELPRLRKVLLEVMRLYPPVPLFQPRRAARAAQVGDFAVPAGTEILISPYVMHRNPAFAPDIEAFRPDRDGNGLCTAHMIPFSVGPRTCQGRNFAMLAVTALMVAILERHHVVLRERGPCPVPSEAVYCRPSHDVAFTTAPRVAAEDTARAHRSASGCPFH